MGTSPGQGEAPKLAPAFREHTLPRQHLGKKMIPGVSRLAVLKTPCWAESCSFRVWVWEHLCRGQVCSLLSE